MTIKRHLSIAASALMSLAILFLSAPPAVATGVCDGVQNADKTPPCVEVRHKCNNAHCISRTVKFDCPTRPSGGSVILRHNDHFHCKGTSVNIHRPWGLQTWHSYCGDNKKGRIDWVGLGGLSQEYKSYCP